MSAGYTPGPWELRALKNGWGIFPASASKKNWSLDDVICGGEGDYDHLWDKEPDEANARLIAAAPALYEALVELIDLNDEADTCMGGLADCRDGGNGPVQSRELQVVIEGARAALSLARGEQ